MKEECNGLWPHDAKGPCSYCAVQKQMEEAAAREYAMLVACANVPSYHDLNKELARMSNAQASVVVSAVADIHAVHERERRQQGPWHAFYLLIGFIVGALSAYTGVFK